jgi:pre-mRNA-processing factor 40
MSEWTKKFTEDGRIFFEHVSTLEKSWIKPESLKTEGEKQTAWVELSTASGSVYYLNQSTQERSEVMPEELIQFKNQQAAKQLTAQLLEEQEEAEEGQITEEGKADTDKRTYADGKDAFFQMFQESGVTSTWRWDDFYRMMKDDERFNLIRTVAHKKQIFNDYVTTLRRKEREEARMKKQVARDNFVKMLDSAGILRPDSKYYKTSHFFQGDPRWRILEEKEREDLFQDYLDELERRDKEKKHQERLGLMNNFRKLLHEREDIDHSTHWLDACKALSGVAAFEALDHLDQLTVFSEYVVEAEKTYYEHKRTHKRTQERKHREQFKELLLEKAKLGELTAATHWRPFLQAVKGDSRYLDLVGQPGSTPKELFDSVVDQLKEDIKPQRADLLEALGDTVVTVGMTYEAVLERVQTHEKFLSIEEGLRLTVFKVLLDEAHLREKKRTLKHKKAVIRFKDFLRSLPNIASTSKFEEFEAAVAESLLRFKRLTEAEMKTLFDRYVHRLREEELSLDIEPGEIKRRSSRRDQEGRSHRRESRHRHRSRSESRHKRSKH